MCIRDRCARNHAASDAAEPPVQDNALASPGASERSGDCFAAPEAPARVAIARRPPSLEPARLAPLRDPEGKERDARRNAVEGDPGAAFRETAASVLDVRHPDAEEREVGDDVGVTRALALCGSGRGLSARDIRVVATARARRARHEARHMCGEVTHPVSWTAHQRASSNRRAPRNQRVVMVHEETDACLAPKQFEGLYMQ